MGKISFAGSSGAAPVIFVPSSDGRTATASFNNEHLSLNLYAYKRSEQTQGFDTTKKYDNVVVDQSGYFVFCFEEKGSYIIYAEVLRNGIKCATGTTKVYVTGYTTNTVGISTSPLVTEDGRIQLSVSTATDITPQIKKVSVSWINSFSGHVEDNADGTHESSEYESAMLRRDDVLNGKYNKSFDVVNGTATISYDNFPGGNWLAKISFEDETENSLYSCQEIINVYPTFTTNRWYGSSSALNNGTFKITKNMVTNYDPEIVPSFNKVMLWNFAECNEGSNYGRFYFLVNENSIGSFEAPVVPDVVDEYDFSELDTLGADVYSYYSDVGDFTFEDTFFDSEGNIYLALSSDAAPSPGSGITSSRSGWSHVSWSDLGVSNEAGKGFTVDFKTKIAYSLEESGAAYIYKYTNMLSSKGQTPTNTRTELDLQNPDDFCVYNNIVYILKEVEDGIYSITSFDLTSEEDPIPAIKSITLNLNYIIGTNRPSYPSFGNMLYQDGYIYILYREEPYFSESTSIVYGRGAVVRVNIGDGSITTAGLTSNYLARDNIKLQGFSDNMAPMYEDSNCERPLILSLTDAQKASRYPEYIYTPSEGDNCFYGPTKFVAVKPKKLVIADEGMAFYTDHDALRYKNVNRIVYVDLDNFVNGISEEVTLDSSVTLTSDTKDLLHANMIEGNNVDFYTPEFEEMQGSISYYVGIPCDDN